MTTTTTTTTKPLEATIVDQFDAWAASRPHAVAVECHGHQLTYAALRAASLRVARALLAAGVQPYDKVAVLTDMSLPMVPAVLGTLRTGAAYVPIDVPAWSRARVDATLSELASPYALVTAPVPGGRLALPARTVHFQVDWLRSPSLLGAAAPALAAELQARRRAFQDDLLSWVTFTSGTTGKPKGVMVYHRAIHALVTAFVHMDYLESTLGKSIRVLLAFSVAFDACAAVVWSTLTKGRTVVMASPSTFPEAATRCDVLDLTPSMLASLAPSPAYDRAACIFLAAEAPNLEVVREWARPGRKIFNTYGPTESTCIISVGEIDPDEEPPFGEIVAGAKVVLVDHHLRECDEGEVLIGGPNLAAGYFNNDELTAAKFIRWNGERWYRTGDLAKKTEDGGFVWAGRTDALVKNRGFLVNLETEVGPALRSFPAVRVAVSLKWRDKLVGLVQPASVPVDELRAFLRQRYDPFVVPDDIVAVESFPLTVHGKVDTRALLAQLDERFSHQDDDDDDPGQVEDDGRGAVSCAYDALRLAFSKTLHVPAGALDSSSSFTRLGGNSLAAIRLANGLKRYGYSVLAIQVLRLDTIGELQKIVAAIDTQAAAGEEADDYTTGPAVATDVQRGFLQKWRDNPGYCALVGAARYVGDGHAVPTARELHEAFVVALSAHTIFRTRFGAAAAGFALSDLGRLNLTWDEVSVPLVDELEAAVAAQEAKALRATQDVARVVDDDMAVPYFAITAVTVPGRRAAAFVTRAHHALVDEFSAALLLRDVERALRGRPVAPATPWADFARFKVRYQQRNLPRAIARFGAVLGPLPDTSVLRPPAPAAPPRAAAYWDLAVLDAPCYGLTRAALDAAAAAQGITASTVVYAAWALFLRHASGGWDRVGFSVSLSGRTVPWPPALAVVGPLVGRAPFSTAVPAGRAVRAWLADVHRLTLDVMEFDGVAGALPDAMRQNPTTTSTNVQYLLDMPQTPPAWTFKATQKHGFLLDWYLYPPRGAEGLLRTELEFNFAKVDEAWAKEAAKIPGRMLQGLVSAGPTTMVGDLLNLV